MSTITVDTSVDALIPGRGSVSTSADAETIMLRQTSAYAYIPVQTQVSTQADAWIGEVTRRTLADALLLRTLAKTTTADAYRVRLKQTTADAYVTELEGSFRGVGSMADRDALLLKQPGDTFVTTNKPGANTPRHEYYTGSEWLSAGLMVAPESKEKQAHVAPTEGSWRAEMGDPVYPFQYYDGAQRPFAVTTDGTIQANALNWSTGAQLANNYITLPEPTSLSTPAARSGQLTTTTAAPATSVSATWPSTPVAGNLLVACVSFAPVSGSEPATSPTAGWTGVSPSATGTQMYWRVADGTETNFTLSFIGTSTNARLTINEYTGISTSAPFDVASARELGGSTTNHSTSYTAQTNASSELWIGVSTVRAAQAQSFSASNGFTELASGVTSSVSQFVGHRIATSTGTAGFETSTVGAGTSSGMSATFKAALVPVPAPGTDKVRLYGAPAQSTTTAKAKGSDGLELDMTSGAVLAASNTPVTVQNTTTQTTVLSYTIPAGIFTVGSGIEIEAWGTTGGQATSGTLNWAMFKDGVDHGNGFTFDSVATARTRYWSMRYVLQIVDVVGLSNAEGHWTIISDWPTAGNERIKVSYAMGSAHNFETTATTLDFKVQWATASASNFQTVSGYNVRLYR